MLGKDQCEAILTKALNLTAADAADFYLSAQDQGLTRFAGNTIHQNVSHSNAQLHVRAVVGKRQGRSVTNDLSDEGVAKAVAQACHNASLMPEDPDFLGLPDPVPTPKVSSFHEPTAAYTPEQRAQAVATVCWNAGDRGLNAFGACRTGSQEEAVFSTSGART